MASLKPGSQQPLTNPTDIAEHSKCQEKMKSEVDWLRRYCADASTCASGRVMPALLANIRAQGQKLEEIATVGVRDGSMLVMTVFDEDRQDTRRLRVTVPKPTLNAKSLVVAAAGKRAEEARVQCRKLHQTSVKKGKYGKQSVELAAAFPRSAGKILVDMEKALGVS
ncbi:ribosome recycling factor [Desarmillaria tabescens]|uniref:Ribosome recycling factor n=1 Tax=Armillaria tabescens TaxID=1929756 RepID=A0AA39K041_ARMTA|nr:ribosome recycling factor [Desarmillaria tabescens]KAK0452009.1 ribosome recycling factor [Desarmillaria tabescens]